MTEESNYMPMRELRHDWPAVALIALMLIVGAIAYPHLPARVAVHFGMNGQPNGWSSPLFAVLIEPIMALGIWLLMVWLPAADPRRRNYAQFGGSYRAIRLAVVLLFVVLDLSTIWRAMGHPLNIRDVAILVVSCMFIFLGNLLGRVRTNWFVGIRTPWTLSDEEVWRRTHRFASRLFVVAGIVPLIALALSPSASAIVLLVCIALAVLGSVVYSYAVFERRPH